MTPVNRPRAVPLLSAVLACLVAAGLTAGLAAPARAAGRTILVAPGGTDTWTVSAAAERPLASITRAIRLARPGDTIRVSGGTYVGAAGWGAVPGTRSAPIRLRNAPGERVVIKGTLQLDNADHWQVSGINVTRNPADGTKQFLVKFDGGTGWSFTNAEVWGGRGVSNLMVSGSAANGHPKNYRIAGNCIHDNDAHGDAFMNYHQVYLMPGYDSGPGVVERNVFFDTENGAAIKAAGPDAATGAARVSIRRNTIARSAAGVIVGHASHHITMSRNLVTQQVKKPPSGAKWVSNYDAAVIGNHVTGSGNVARETAVSGFDRSVRSTKDSRRPVTGSRTAWVTPRFDSTASCSGFRPRGQAAGYGRWS
jgi:hypothetical protein